MPQVDLEFRATYQQQNTGIVIPVRIQLDGPPGIEFEAKIDTGSEYCVFQRSYAERLGLTVEDGDYLRCQTANGSLVEAYGHELTLVTFGFEVTGTYYFFADEWAPRSLLGRIGWLNRLRLLIDDTSDPGLLLASPA